MERAVGRLRLFFLGLRGLCDMLQGYLAFLAERVCDLLLLCGIESACLIGRADTHAPLVKCLLELRVLQVLCDGMVAGKLAGACRKHLARDVADAPFDSACLLHAFEDSRQVLCLPDFFSIAELPGRRVCQEQHEGE